MAIRDPIREIRIDTISLDRPWRADEPNELDFILVARRRKQNIGMIDMVCI